MIEPLEPRIAPAGVTILPGGKSASFTDVDGDIVRVTTTKGVFTPAHFQFGPVNELNGQQLQVLDMLAGGKEAQFANATIVFSVEIPAEASDNRVNLGFLRGAEFDNFPGVALKEFFLPGDVGKIFLGAHSRAREVTTLQVDSVGKFGTTNGAPDLKSQISGRINLEVHENVDQASVSFSGGIVHIAGNLIGGAAAQSGELSWFSTGGKTSIRVEGNIIGGEGAFSGRIAAAVAGTAYDIKIGGSLIGGVGVGSGRLDISRALPFPNTPTSPPKPGFIQIVGDIVGGSGAKSGLLAGDFLSIRQLEIGGDIIGGTGTGSGGVEARSIAKAVIQGSIIGGSNASATQRLDRSGFIEAAEIGTLTIDGSVVSGTDAGGGLSSSGSIRADKTITKLWVKGITAFAGQAFGSKGGLIGNATSNVVISAGKTLATLIVGAENTVSAQVLRTEILAGYFHDTTSNVRGDAGNADADITTVRINGDFFASSIVAGVQAGADGYFGTADDASIVGGTDVRANQSKISSVVIRGLVAGTGSINDHFGIVAESVGSVRVGGALVAGLNSRLNIIDLISATTGDLTVREVI